MFIRNWRRVLLRASSMWCVYIAAILQVAENAIPYMSDYLPWWMPIAVLVLAPLFRILSQGGLDADKQDHADETR
ncbi:DUF7940 domain-containing protein [Agrobacterium sp. ST15.13.015]|uniref:DUF7940 domain-containing protein n=1 Tax=Agrobacterium sp. ST15.13.015 TaxID=3017319 RepID=UPI0022BB7282|nr:hypothetical protein [Agrobacterium sp. ST15.13.015]MCZ7501277.1 hypothetical protein [Rhizobium rhizogenes]